MTGEPKDLPQVTGLLVTRPIRFSTPHYQSLLVALRYHQEHVYSSFLYSVTHSCANQNQVYKFHRITWCRRVLVHCMLVSPETSLEVSNVSSRDKYGTSTTYVRVARRGTSTIPIVGQVGLLF